MNSEIINQTGNAEFAEIEAEISELESYFGDLGLDDDDQESSSSELSELDAAIAGSEFADGGTESSVPSTFLDMADSAGQGEQQEAFGLSLLAGYIAKKAAKKVIKWGLGRIRKSAKFRKGGRRLASAINAFKHRKYGTALKLGYSTAKWIRAQF